MNAEDSRPGTDLPDAISPQGSATSGSRSAEFELHYLQQLWVFTSHFREGRDCFRGDPSGCT
jgi:hypothetical protein